MSKTTIPFVSKKGNIKVDQPRELTAQDYMNKWARDGVLHKADKTLDAIEGGRSLRADNERDGAIVASVRQQVASDPAVADAFLDMQSTQPEVGEGVEQNVGSQPTLSVNPSSSATFPVPNLWDVRMTPGSGATPTVDVYLPTTGVWIYRDATGTRHVASLSLTGITRNTNTCWGTTDISWSTTMTLYANRTGAVVTIAVGASGDDSVQLVGTNTGGTPTKVVQMYRGIINAGGGAGGAAAAKGDADTTPLTSQNTIKQVGTDGDGVKRLGLQNVTATTTPDGTETVVCIWKDGSNVYQQVIVPTTGI